MQRRDGSWILVGNDWEERRAERQAHREARMHPDADFDRDGIANRYDRDADGDGVRNGHDRYPYNRNRS